MHEPSHSRIHDTQIMKERKKNVYELYYRGNNMGLMTTADEQDHKETVNSTVTVAASASLT